MKIDFQKKLVFLHVTIIIVIIVGKLIEFKSCRKRENNKMAVITENKFKKYQEGTMFNLVHSYQPTDDDSHLVVTPKSTAQQQSTPQSPVDFLMNEEQVSPVYRYLYR